MKTKNVLGWIAVAVSTLFAGIWAFWGSIENFHEGWFYESFWLNVGLMLVQYWLFALIFTFLNLIALRWPRFGGAFFIVAAVLIPAVWIRTFAAIVLFAVPLGAAGLLYWMGRPEPKRWACRIAVGLPLLVLFGGSLEPAWRVARRLDDGNLGIREIAGNGVALQWAPAGPGWPQHHVDFPGGTWYDAVRICSHLNASGTALSDSALNIWRLPTVEEVVRTQARHGANAGGTWDPATGKASYRILPDKESPLWRHHSPVIYWWTATAVDERSAYRAVYNGGVQKLPKNTRAGYLGFRAVRDVPAPGR